MCLSHLIYINNTIPPAVGSPVGPVDLVRSFVGIVEVVVVVGIAKMMLSQQHVVATYHTVATMCLHTVVFAAVAVGNTFEGLGTLVCNNLFFYLLSFRILRKKR